MINYTDDLEDIVNGFKKLKIPTEQPGFYDHPNFTGVEKNNPLFLNNYARFVNGRGYKTDYLEYAKKVIPIIVQLLFDELVRDGRLGACIDVSMVLSRILEKEGIWNYIVKGALTIDFAKNTNIETKHYWPIDYTDANAAHVWVVAPPYTIIDVTIRQQPYRQNEVNHLPNFVIEMEPLDAEMIYTDIISPEVRAYLRSKGVRNSEMIRQVNPEMVTFIDVFRPSIVKYNDTTLKYIPCGIAAPEWELERIKSLKLNGNYGIDIYRKVIKPVLNNLSL